MKRAVDFRFFMPPLQGLEVYCALFPGRGRTVCSLVCKSRFRVPVHSQGTTVAFRITIGGT